MDTSPVLLVSRGWDEGEHYTAHFCVSEEKAVWFLHARGCLDSSIFSAFDVESLVGGPGEARIQNSFSRGDPCQGSLFHNEIFMSAGSLLTQGQHIFLFFFVHEKFMHEINLLAMVLRRHLAPATACVCWLLLEKTYYF